MTFYDILSRILLKEHSITTPLSGICHLPQWVPSLQSTTVGTILTVYHSGHHPYSQPQWVPSLQGTTVGTNLTVYHSGYHPYSLPQWVPSLQSTTVGTILTVYHSGYHPYSLPQWVPSLQSTPVGIILTGYHPYTSVTEVKGCPRVTMLGWGTSSSQVISTRAKVKSRGL